MTVPTEIRTPRLFLRPWRSDDAVRLQPILAENWAHLSPWIPARIADPATVPLVADRLAGFEADFAADREWRYAMLSADQRDVLGEIALFPRSAAGRVAYRDADRAEIGYWLRADWTGRGLVTEAARAVLDVAIELSQVSVVEIRCDARNGASSAVPRRLGFVLGAESSTESNGQLEIWCFECAIATE